MVAASHSCLQHARLARYSCKDFGIIRKLKATTSTNGHWAELWLSATPSMPELLCYAHKARPVRRTQHIGFSRGAASTLSKQLRKISNNCNRIS
jgi:hypothetical protein